MKQLPFKVTLFCLLCLTSIDLIAQKFHVPVSPIRVSASYGSFFHYGPQYSHIVEEGSIGNLGEGHDSELFYDVLQLQATISLSSRVSVGAQFEFSVNGEYYNPLIIDNEFKRFKEQNSGKYGDRPLYGGMSSGQFEQDWQIQEFSTTSIGLIATIDLFKEKNHLIQPYVSGGINYTSRTYESYYGIAQKGLQLVAHGWDNLGNVVDESGIVEEGLTYEEGIKEYLDNNPNMGEGNYTKATDGSDSYVSNDGVWGYNFHNGGYETFYNHEDFGRQIKVHAWQYLVSVGARIAITPRIFANAELAYTSIFTSSSEVGTDTFNTVLGARFGVGYTFGRLK